MDNRTHVTAGAWAVATVVMITSVVGIVAVDKIGVGTLVEVAPVVLLIAIGTVIISMPTRL